MNANRALAALSTKLRNAGQLRCADFKNRALASLINNPKPHFVIEKGGPFGQSEGAAVCD